MRPEAGRLSPLPYELSRAPADYENDSEQCPPSLLLQLSTNDASLTQRMVQVWPVLLKRVRFDETLVPAPLLLVAKSTVPFGGSEVMLTVSPDTSAVTVFPKLQPPFPRYEPESPRQASAPPGDPASGVGVTVTTGGASVPLGAS